MHVTEKFANGKSIGLGLDSILGSTLQNSTSLILCDLQFFLLRFQKLRITNDKMSFNDQAVCLYTSGVLAGFGVAISCLAVPALKETSDPLPAWKRLYKNGSKMAISMIFVTSGLAVKRYLSTEDVRYLMVAGATGFIGPYTGFFMKATNDALFSFKDNEYREKREDENKVKKLISKWAKLQYGRTLLGLVGFAINAWIVSKAV